MKVLQTLQMMAHEDVLQTSKMSRPVNVSGLLNRLTKTVDKLQDEIENPSIPKPSLDALQVWTKFQENKFDFNSLDSREKRALCIDPRTAVHPQVIRAIDARRDVFVRASTLYGFVGCYFTKWREIAKRDKTEQLLVHLILEEASRRHSRILATWAANPDLFSKDADTWIAMEALDKRLSVAEVCSKWFVVVPSQLTQAAEESALKLAVSSLIDKPKTSADQAVRTELKWIADKLLMTSLTPECYRREIGRLILSTIGERYPSVIQLITEWVSNDSRLGDPRLSHSEANWRMMPTGTREKLLSWLAKETIEFFFNAIVPQNDDNRRRAEFWLEYAKKPGKIKDFQVALSEDDARLLRRRSLENVNYPRLTDAKTSAFMMQFDGYGGQQYVVVEFSETGNAAYIYNRRDLPSTRLSFRWQSFSIHQLRRAADEYDRIIHNGDWEVKASYLLYELGIQP